MVFVLAMLITIVIIWFIVSRPKKKRFIQDKAVQETQDAIESPSEIHVEPPQTVEKAIDEEQPNQEEKKPD